MLVIVLGTTAPLIGRWRKRKMLEREGSPNLSFTNEESTNDVTQMKRPGKKQVPTRSKAEPRKVA